MSTVKGDTLYSQFKINVGDKVYITQKGELESVVPGYCHLECFTVVSKQADLPKCNTYEIINGDTIWVVCDEDFEEGDLAIYQMLSPTEKLELWRRQGIDMRDDSFIEDTTIPFDEECECHITNWSQAEMNKQKMIEEGMEGCEGMQEFKDNINELAGRLQEYRDNNLEDEYDIVKKPSHYQLFPEFNLEIKDINKRVLERIEDSGFDMSLYEAGFFQQALQYLMRGHAKGGLEDYKKAIQTLQFVVDSMEERNM